MKVLQLLSIIIISISTFANVTNNNARFLKDFNNNIFKIYEKDNFYSIYELDNGYEYLIEEGEFNSPYSDIKTDDLYYFGPFNYFYKKDNYLVNIENNNIIDISYMQGCGFDIIHSIEEQITTHSGELYYCNNYKYFQKLNFTPYNEDEACGIIALGMLLGYYDTFYDDRFIDNDVYYSGVKYSGNFINIQNLGTYKGQKKYYFDLWNNSPGTTQAFYDYLLNNFIHTFHLYIGSGHPMTNTEMRYTMEDYLEYVNPNLKNTFYYNDGALLDVSITKPYTMISKGNPVSLILLNGTYDSTLNENTSKQFKNNFHIVVAYGYYDGKYIVNAGYQGNYYKKIYLTECTINSYFGIDYYAIHKYHSKNAYLLDENNNYYNVCGCGEVL